MRGYQAVGGGGDQRCQLALLHGRMKHGEVSYLKSFGRVHACLLRVLSVLYHLDFFPGGKMSNKHAGTAAASTQAVIPEPSFAERARTLLHLGRVGSLSTLSRKRPGFPFGSLMPFALDGAGRPVFLISTMAMHTQNLQQDGRASLLVTQPEASGDPLGAGRVTLVGNVSLVPAAEVGEARGLYLEHHE